MLLGVFLFSFNDAVGKWLVATYSVGQFLLIRSATTLILLAPFIWRAGRQRSGPRRGPACSCCASCCRRSKSRCSSGRSEYLPLADAITFYLAGPIYVTALSALFLRERVGWRRWSAVLVGFLGVSSRCGPPPPR